MSAFAFACCRRCMCGVLTLGKQAKPTSRACKQPRHTALAKALKIRAQKRADGAEIVDVTRVQRVRRAGAKVRESVCVAVCFHAAKYVQTHTHTPRTIRGLNRYPGDHPRRRVSLTAAQLCQCAQRHQKHGPTPVCPSRHWCCPSASHLRLVRQDCQTSMAKNVKC